MYNYSNLTYVSIIFTLLPDSILTTAEFSQSVKELYILYTTKYTNLWHTLLTGTDAMLLVAVCTG